MESQVNNTPVLAPGPPPPPPLPGSVGGVSVPNWRAETHSHLAPSKEEIEKEQYANLPDKLINALNKDKKPFTYTPHGVSGIEKGKLDLTEIRSPKMKKRLMANLLVDEDEDSSSDFERSRSETPDLLTKPKSVSHRAITPDVISLNRQTGYVPVLPVLPVKEPVFPSDRNSPIITFRNSPQEICAQQQEQHLQHQQQQPQEWDKLQPQQPQPLPPPIPPKPILTPQEFDSLMYKQLEGLKNSSKNSAVNSNNNNNNNTESKSELSVTENVSFLYPSRSDTESRSETSADECNENNVILIESENEELGHSRDTEVAELPNNDRIQQNGNITIIQIGCDTCDDQTDDQEVIVNENNLENNSNNNDANQSSVPIPPPLPPPTYRQPPPPPPQIPEKTYQSMQKQQQINEQPINHSTMHQTIPQLQSQPTSQQPREQYRESYLTNGNNGRDINAAKSSYDSNGNNIRQPSPWESEVLRHVLDGGLQEELEKFEQISLEAEHKVPSRTATPLQYGSHLYGEPQMATTIEETYERTEIVANQIETAPIKFKDARELFKRIQETESAAESASFNAFRRTRSPQPPPETPCQQSMWGSSQNWSDYQTAPTRPPPPPPTPRAPAPQYTNNQRQSPLVNSNNISSGNASANNYSQSVDPLYRGGNIPSKSFQYIKQKTGITDAEVQNYNCRPKPFYLSVSSPSPTPSPQQTNLSHFSTFGKNLPQNKIDYLETETTEAPIPQRDSYLESSKMFSQTTYAESWPDSGVDYSPTCSEYEPNYNTPAAAAARRKRLPPSERPPDPTPPKYQGSSIPSRSFRFLQLITGEDIENQYQNNPDVSNKKPQSSFKPTKPLNIPNPLNSSSNNTNQVRNYGNSFDDSGTDF